VRQRGSSPRTARSGHVTQRGAPASNEPARSTLRQVEEPVGREKRPWIAHRRSSSIRLVEAGVRLDEQHHGNGRSLFRLSERLAEPGIGRSIAQSPLLRVGSYISKVVVRTDNMKSRVRDPADLPAPVLDIGRRLHVQGEPPLAEGLRGVEQSRADVLQPFARRVGAVRRAVAVRPLVIARRVHRGCA